MRWGIGVLSAAAAVAAFWGTPKPHVEQPESPVSVRLRHPWYTGDARAAYVVEMLEAAARIWPSDVFALVERVAAPDGLARAGDVGEASAQTLYEALDAIIGEHALISDAIPAQDEWRAAVAMHSQAAHAASYYQLFHTSRALHGIDLECAYIYFDHHGYCGVDEARAAIERRRSEAVDGAAGAPLPSDHVYAPRASVAQVLPTAVLYADPFDPALAAKHTLLMQLADDVHAPIQYVLRWRPTPQRHDDALTYLSGFGAALHLKKVDYLVIDDRKVDAAPNATLDAATTALLQHERETYHTLSSQLYAPGKAPKRVQDAVAAQSALKDDDRARLGIGAAHAVLTATDPLETLIELTHNFPAHAAGVAQYAARLPAGNTVTKAVEELQERVVDAGMSMAWMNGKALPLTEYAPHEVLERVRSERVLLTQFAAPEIGIDAQNALLMLTNAQVNAAFLPGVPSAARYDASDRIERAAHDAPVVAWRNDLAVDGAERWPTDLRVLLQPRWPGQPVSLAHNLFHLVVVVNMTDASAVSLCAQIVASELEAYGLHLGLVPLLDASPAAEAMAEVLWHATDALSNDDLTTFLSALADAPDAAAARRLLAPFVRDQPASAARAFVEKGARTPAMEARLAATRAYLQRLGVPLGGPGAAFLNGQEVSYSDAVLQEAMGVQLSQTRLAAADIHAGRIAEDAVPTYFYDLPDTRRSRSRLVSRLAGTEPASFVNLPDVVTQLATTAAAPHLGVLRDFVYHDERPVNVSVRLVADLDAPAGRALAVHALEALQHTPFRVSFVHVPSTAASGRVSRFLYAAQAQGVLSTLAPATLRDALAGDTLDALARSLKLDVAAQADAADAFWATAAVPFAAAVRGAGVLLNGRVLDAIDVDAMHADEFAAIVDWEQQQHVAPLLDTLDINDDERGMAAQALEFVTALLGAAFSVPNGGEGAYASRPPTRMALGASLEQSAAAFSVGAADADVHVALIVDPLSDQAPGLAATTRMLAGLDGVRVTVILNPRVHETRLPLQQFTQYDARLRPLFGDTGSEQPPGVAFALLPPQAVLTMQLLAPRTLVAMAAEAVYDLDNIRLADLAPAARGTGVEAVYAVQSVLVEGHARTNDGGVPSGLQLLLMTDDEREVLDTIVMENMGYFQFRAQPGAWRLAIRPGRSADVYALERAGTAGRSNAPAASTDGALVVASLLGKPLYPVVAKHPGMESADLIAEMDAPTPSDVATSRRGGHADINVFTLASGHLYERMTYIMILSVLEHTQHSVKFWFVENFLSPSFKAFIPHLAAAYGFRYEMITFAWPQWLRAQTEKQRTIWAYKILFLDVLFPLDLDRVIFVDADQIVRADLYELVTMDLHGVQHLLPIYTLDKTWLWCETWCSHDWLPQAKTIDLCSNPKTKEPKLDRARRQIPEWNVLDAQVAALAARVAQGDAPASDAAEASADTVHDEL
ncbi:hypothetical protein CBS9595_003517 [Malassezia furfur]|nr:hypothetical protein CBS9595_003517 [Malassezia furfur]